MEAKRTEILDNGVETDDTQAARHEAVDQVAERASADLSSLVARTPAIGAEITPGAAAAEPRSLLTDQKAVEAEPKAPPHPRAGTFNFGDRLFDWITVTFAGLIIAILVAMLALLVIRSHASITQFGLGFLTSSSWDTAHDRYGAATSILGTLYTSLIALLIAAPIGVFVAIFLVEISPRRLRFPLGFVVELLAAVPSIVYGLWALFVLVPLVAQHIEPWFLDHFGNTFLFVGTPIGLGYLTAALILAVMILPTIASISRDAMLSVPNGQRDAMLALGATRWEMIWKVVVPIARSGIIGAVVLALGRAVGETMAVQMVIGNNLTQFSLSLFNTGTTMPATLVNQFAEASGLQLSALLELGLILLLISVVLNALAQLLVAQTGVQGRKGKGGRRLRLPFRRPAWVPSLAQYRLRKSMNSLGTVLTVACTVAAIIPLVAMMYYVIQQGASSIDLAFFTQLPAAAGESGGGMASQIAGTLVLIGIASLVGLPIGLLSGIYLSRTAHIRFANAVRFFTDVIAGTPSIIAGLVAYSLIVIPMGSFSALSGGVALGLLMFPTVTRATEEAIRLVPGVIREAALGLGLPEWKTMARIIVPAAANGIVTAIMLGIARVAGETAPLVFTAFGTDAYPGSPLHAVGALPLKIWVFATGPYQTWHQQAWAGALTLFAIILILNLSARLLTYRLSKRVAVS